jgi:polyisoprenoid-binding protein YceI
MKLICHGFKVIASVFTMLLFAAGVWALPSDYELDGGSSILRFRVHSTFHEVRGSAALTKTSARFDPEKSEFFGPLRVRIPVESLESGNRLRDRSMRGMFRPETYPEITVEVQSLTCGENGKSRDCVAAGTLEMHGQKNSLEFPLRLIARPGWIRASGEARLNRKEFNLKPPGIPGLVKVAAAVVIEFDTVWKSS